MLHKKMPEKLKDYNKLMVVYLVSHVRLFVTPRTIAHQVPVSIEFCRQQHWSGLPFPFPGDLPDPGTAGRFFTN